MISNGINPIAIRVAVGHGILLIHIIANQDDEGNGNDETDGLDDGVEFVSGKEFDVTAHFFLIKNGQRMAFIVPK